MLCDDDAVLITARRVGVVVTVEQTHTIILVVDCMSSRRARPDLGCKDIVSVRCGESHTRVQGGKLMCWGIMRLVRLPPAQLQVMTNVTILL
jgi:hypothetical protein